MLSPNGSTSWAYEYDPALRQAASISLASQTLEAVDHNDLLEVVEQWENCSMWSARGAVKSDPTWRFYIVVTDYSQSTMNNVDKAIEDLLRVQHRYMKAVADPLDVFANEA